jgi:outer membrane lipoprotein-sorting protein
MFVSIRAKLVVVIASAAAVLTAGVARAQTADEIIAKNLQAKGGVEKLKAMNTVKISGKILMQGMELPMTTWAKRPNKMRREMQMQDQKIVSGFDGTTVWMINPMAGADGPREVTGPQADMAREDADFDGLLVDYKAKGHTVEFVGTETVGGRKLQHLKITKKNGQVQDYYIDPETGMEARTVMTVEQGGMKAEVTTDLSNYQTVDGLSLPFSMRQSMNGTPVAQVTIEKVEFNVPIDDAIFKMPAKQ